MAAVCQHTRPPAPQAHGRHEATDRHAAAQFSPLCLLWRGVRQVSSPPSMSPLRSRFHGTVQIEAREETAAGASASTFIRVPPARSSTAAGVVAALSVACLQVEGESLPQRSYVLRARAMLTG